MGRYRWGALVLRKRRIVEEARRVQKQIERVCPFIRHVGKRQPISVRHDGGVESSSEWVQGIGRLSGTQRSVRVGEGQFLLGKRGSCCYRMGLIDMLGLIAQRVRRHRIRSMALRQGNGAIMGSANCPRQGPGRLMRLPFSMRNNVIFGTAICVQLFMALQRIT